MLKSEFQGYYLNGVVFVFSSDPRAHFLKLKNEFHHNAFHELVLYAKI